jgi:NADH:ubiquinone oxidoreductase subunit 5 (subunit L)/multisubunit Na+/H+ antiporter MnhA subunit
MTVPLMVLAAGAVVAGFVGIPAALGGNNAIEQFLAPSFAAHGAAGVTPATADTPHPSGASVAAAAAPQVPAAFVQGTAVEGHGAPAHPARHLPHLSRGAEIGLMALSVAVALVAIGAAWRAYVTRPAIAEALAARFAGAHRVLTNKYYVDEVYDATLVRGTMGAANVSWRIDRMVIDGLVNASGWFTRLMAWVSGLVDTHGVDGMVNATGNTLWEASFGYRRLQTGLIQNYALVIVCGVAVLVSLYLFVR